MDFYLSSMSKQAGDEVFIICFSLFFLIKKNYEMFQIYSQVKWIIENIYVLTNYIY